MAVSALVPTPLADGQLPSSSTVLYTVPPGLTVLLKSFSLTNTVAAETEVNIQVNRSGTGRRVLSRDLILPAKGHAEWCGVRILAEGDTIVGQANAANAVDYVFDAATQRL